MMTGELWGRLREGCFGDEGVIGDSVGFYWSVAVGVGNTTFLASVGWVSAGGTWRGVWDGCGRVEWWGWWGKVSQLLFTCLPRLTDLIKQTQNKNFKPPENLVTELREVASN